MKLEKEEIEKWLEVCRQLKDLGAITQDDFNSPEGSDGTPGTRLLVAIQSWGDARFHVALARSKYHTVLHKGDAPEGAEQMKGVILEHLKSQEMENKVYNTITRDPEMHRLLLHERAKATNVALDVIVTHINKIQIT